MTHWAGWAAREECRLVIIGEAVSRVWKPGVWSARCVVSTQPVWCVRPRTHLERILLIRARLRLEIATAVVLPSGCEPSPRSEQQLFLRFSVCGRQTARASMSAPM